MRLIARLHSGYASNRVNTAHTVEGSAATVTETAMVRPSQAMMSTRSLSSRLTQPRTSHRSFAHRGKGR